MDAGGDADDLREFIGKERHLVECFFNRIKLFRRIALRGEKALGSFKAFVDLACTMAWTS